MNVSPSCIFLSFKMNCLGRQLDSVQAQNLILRQNNLPQPHWHHCLAHGDDRFLFLMCCVLGDMSKSRQANLLLCACLLTRFVLRFVFPTTINPPIGFNFTSPSIDSRSTCCDALADPSGLLYSAFKVFCNLCFPSFGFQSGMT